MKKKKSRFILIVISSISFMGATCRAFQVNDNLNIGVKAYLNAMQTYGDHFNSTIVGQTQANENSSNANGFRLSRAYLTIIGKVSKEFSGKLTLDEAYSDPAVSNGRGNVFVKYLYGVYSPVDNIAIRLGLTETPWIPYEEGLWNYRFVSETAPDYEGFMPSSDWGLAIVGDLFDKLVDYHIMFSNGEGYQAQQNGRGYAGAARIALNVKPFIFDIFGMDENMHNGIPDYNPKRAIVMLVYSNSIMRVAGDWMWADDHITIADQNKAKFNHGYGYEFWGFMRIPGEEKIRIFARYLFMKPNGDNSYTPVNGKIAPTTSIGSSNIYSTELLKFVSTSENTWGLIGVSYNISQQTIVAVDYNIFTLYGYNLSSEKSILTDQAIALNLKLAF